MLIQRFTEEYRQEQLEAGKKSLFYFGKAILGIDWLNEFHHDLCLFLEGKPPHHPWRRAAVIAYRGCGKSTCTTIMFPLHNALYVPDFKAKIIENSASNAFKNHFSAFSYFFKESNLADYLSWMYQERIPSGFEGWTATQIQMVRENPVGPPSITFGGIDSKFEGYHGNLIIIDDPEGADAESSMVANDAAYRMWKRSPPLLESPKADQILGVMTPWGSDPLAWKLRDREVNGSLDNAKRKTKLFWVPLLDDSGACRDSVRFPPDVVSELRLEEEVWDSQYMLRRPGQRREIFRIEDIQRFNWRWTDAMRSAVRYTYLKINQDGTYSFESAQSAIEAFRFFLHADPVHLVESQKIWASKPGNRPSQASWVVVGVAPDGHVIVFDTHSDKEADLSKQFEVLFKFYCRYEPDIVTFDSVGAQVWLKDYAKAIEDRDVRYRFPESEGWIDGQPKSLPPISSRLRESDRRGSEDKIAAFKAVLAGYLHRGIIHLNEGQAQLYDQLRNCAQRGSYVDLIDCLLQGPAVWKPHHGHIEDLGAYRRRKTSERLVHPRTSVPIRSTPGISRHASPAFTVV